MASFEAFSNEFEMIRGPKIELYSNEHVDNFFFIIKSFITFYLIRIFKNI